MSAKLIQVNNLIALGGTTTCAAAVCAALPDWEHEVLSLHPVHEPAAEAWFRSRGVRVRRCERVGPHEVAGADFVLLNNTPREAVAPGLNVPTVSWHHSATGRAAPGHVEVSVSAYLNGVEGADRPVLVQGVPDEAAEPICRRWGWRRVREGTFYVGVLCTPQRAKYAPDLVAILAAVDVPEARFEIVGGGHLREEVACLPAGRAARGLSGRVRFREPGVRAARRLWRWHVLLAHNGPTVTETFGRCVVEAMMAGCVPVTDGRGGPCETVRDGQTGWLCTTAGEFVEAIRGLADRRVWAPMSLAARAWAKREFSLAALRERLLSVFEAATERWAEARSWG